MNRIYLFFLILVLLYSCKPQSRPQQLAHNADYEKAYVFREQKNTDSAYVYFIRAKDVFLIRKDSLGIASCLINLCIIAADKADYDGSQQLSLDARRYLDEQNKKHYPYILSNYTSLGVSTQRLGDYDEALRFYQLALRFNTDSTGIKTIQNNLATVYSEKKDYNAAIKLYEKAVAGADHASAEYARALCNLARSRWMQDHQYNAAAAYQEALKIRIQQKDVWGQNASYAHLSDFYMPINTDSAFLYAHKRYQLARLLHSAPDRLDALARLVELSSPQQSKLYFSAYRILEDSIETAGRASRTQYALIKYETEKHKADFSRAQAENIRKENNILRKNIIVGILLVALLVGFWWYRKRQHSMQKDKDLQVKNTELKYVKKIHDRVANKVYQVMSEVENTPELDREVLLDKLELLYNVSRDISYERNELDVSKSFVNEINKLLNAYKAEGRQIFTVGNEEALWLGLSATVQIEVYCIIQELMTNMKKHSEASNVVLKFTRGQYEIHLAYLDNGVGMGSAAKNNGIQNTETRTKSLKGTITFDRSVESGTKIELSFPVA